MALLQISEPGRSTTPHEHRLAVGIDLGTTNSLVATVRSGEAKVLLDQEGRGLVPSVVRYRENDDTILCADSPKLSDHSNAASYLSVCSFS